MKKVFKKIYIVAILMVVITSCSTIDKTVNPDRKMVKAESELFSKIVEQQPEFSTMTTKCTVAIDKLSSKAQIKMINGEYIQISLQPILGIELLRIMMTQDSIIVVDKMNSMVAREPLSALKNKLPNGVGIEELQKMMLGIPFIVGETLTTKKYNNFKWSESGEEITMQGSISKSTTISFVYDKQALLQSALIKYNEEPIVNCFYSQYKSDELGILRPSTVEVQPVNEKLGIPFSVSINNLSPQWNKKVVADTKVSSRYKAVSLETLLKNLLK